MFKSFSLFALTLLLSLTILGPSVIVLSSSDIDIELTQDFEEESQKEANQEVDENEKFFEDFELIPSEIICYKSVQVPFYLQKAYGWSPEMQSPPPEFIFNFFS